MQRYQELFASTYHQQFQETYSLLSSLQHELGSKVITQIYDTTDILIHEMAMGRLLCITALLYRPVQYGLISLDTVEEIWGEQGAQFCGSVVKIAQLSKANMHPQIESLIGLVLTFSEDPRAILVILAEQLNKMRNFNILPLEVQEPTLEEVSLLYAPIAHRLGLYAIKSELEERWMKHAHYQVYRSIADELAAKKTERENFIHAFITPLQEKMHGAQISCEIKGRPKSIFSIWKKMQNQNVGVDGVYDKFAIRIIIETDQQSLEKELCWRAYSLVTEEYRPFPKRLRDWISLPKNSGYESLHITVETEAKEWVEVQIRTRRMDNIAEHGHAAHWKYKEGESTKQSKQDWLTTMRHSLQKSDDLSSDSAIKHSLYGESEIFVFTLDGAIKKVRPDATVLDFAFSIHTNVGMSCSGARVNGKHVSLKHALANGDEVEVQTSSQQTPSAEWVDLVQSPRNKSRIRRFIKAQERPHAEVGKDILLRKLTRIKQQLQSETLDILLAHYHLEEVQDLYEKIGNQEIELSSLKDLFTAPTTEKAPSTPIITGGKQRKTHSDALVIDDNMGNIVFSYAKCCNPLRGDAIFGFVSVNNGVRIHAQRCPNKADLFAHHSVRIVKAQWTDLPQDQRFTAPLTCGGNDPSPLLSSLSTLLKTKGILLQNFSLNPQGVTFEAELVVEVHHREELKELKEALLLINGVSHVY